MRQTSIASAILLAAVPVLASAWSPYGPDGFVPPAYYGFPGYYGGAGSMPPGPWGAGYPGPWAGMPPAAETAPDRAAVPADPAQPPLAGSDWGAYGRPLRAMPRIPRLDISRQMGDSDYLIDIRVENIEPDQVEIRPARSGLVISYDKSVQTSQEDQLAGGDGYRRSYSISRGTTTRRVGLPADAKLDEMSREVDDGHIRLRIPRDASMPGRYW